MGLKLEKLPDKFSRGDLSEHTNARSWGEGFPQSNMVLFWSSYLKSLIHQACDFLSRESESQASGSFYIFNMQHWCQNKQNFMGILFAYGVLKSRDQARPIIRLGLDCYVIQKPREDLSESGSSRRFQWVGERCESPFGCANYMTSHVLVICSFFESSPDDHE